MLVLNGSFSAFMSSLFGFLRELLTGIFSYLSDIFSGLHGNIT